jgi:nicotinamide mononucleotide transporter
MATRKLIENWWYWVALDLAAAVLFAAQGLFVTSMLFVLYTGLALHGYRQWRRDARAAVPDDRSTTHA